MKNLKQIAKPIFLVATLASTPAWATGYYQPEEPLTVGDTTYTQEQIQNMDNDTLNKLYADLNADQRQAVMTMVSPEQKQHLNNENANNAYSAAAGTGGAADVNNRTNTNTEVLNVNFKRERVAAIGYIENPCVSAVNYDVDILLARFGKNEQKLLDEDCNNYNIKGQITQSIANAEIDQVFDFLEHASKYPTASAGESVAARTEHAIYRVFTMNGGDFLPGAENLSPYQSVEDLKKRVTDAFILVFDARAKLIDSGMKLQEIKPDHIVGKIIEENTPRVLLSRLQEQRQQELCQYVAESIVSDDWGSIEKKAKKLKTAYAQCSSGTYPMKSDDAQDVIASLEASTEEGAPKELLTDEAFVEKWKNSRSVQTNPLLEGLKL